MSQANLPRNLELVLLDRDGVINVDSEDYIKDPDEWLPLPGALTAIAKLQQHVTVAICTNQSGVGRGLLSVATLRNIHEKLQALLRSSGGSPINIYFCPHTPDAGCECRKPLPGLLATAMNHFNANAEVTLFAGDSARDLDAAAASGCLPVLLRTGNGEKTLATYSPPPIVFRDLSELTASVAASKRPD